jgi:hypothetical protein
MSLNVAPQSETPFSKHDRRSAFATQSPEDERLLWADIDLADATGRLCRCHCTPMEREML